MPTICSPSKPNVMMLDADEFIRRLLYEPSKGFRPIRSSARS
jgi:hypothetical protein